MANLSFFIIFWVFCVCVTASYMYTHYHRMLSKSDQEKNQALCEGWRRVSMGSARAHARTLPPGRPVPKVQRLTADPPLSPRPLQPSPAPDAPGRPTRKPAEESQLILVHSFNHAAFGARLTTRAPNPRKVATLSRRPGTSAAPPPAPAGSQHRLTFAGTPCGAPPPHRAPVLVRTRQTRRR